MQQTEKYKLNLIEPSDPFLPEGLNANTQKVEEVLQTHMEGPLAELDQRVTVLEGHRFACGTYKDDGTVPYFIPLGFTPEVVLVLGPGASTNKGMVVANDKGVGMGMEIVEGGFQVDHYMAGSVFHNYIAFG